MQQAAFSFTTTSSPLPLIEKSHAAGGIVIRMSKGLSFATPRGLPHSALLWLQHTAPAHAPWLSCSTHLCVLCTAQSKPSCWLMNLTPRSGNMATRYGFGDKRGSLFLLLLLTAGETETAVGFTACITPTTGWVTKAPLPLPLKPKGFRCHPQALGNPSWL